MGQWISSPLREVGRTVVDCYDYPPIVTGIYQDTDTHSRTDSRFQIAVIDDQGILRPEHHSGRHGQKKQSLESRIFGSQPFSLSA